MTEIRKCPFCDEGEMHPDPKFSLNYFRPIRGRGVKREKIESLLCNKCGMIAFRKVKNADPKKKS